MMLRYLLAFLLSPLCIAVGLSQIGGYPQAFDLKGEVVKIEEFYLLPGNSDDIELEIFQIRSIFLNESRQPISMTTKRSGKSSQLIYSYESGRLQRMLEYDAEDQLYASADYEYQDQRLLRSTVHYPEARYAANAVNEFIYGEPDTVYVQFGTGDERLIYIEDRLTAIEGEDLLIGNFRKEFRYDESGELREMISSGKHDSENYRYTYAYQYDRAGNFVERISTDEQGDTLDVLYRAITYRDQTWELRRPQDMVGAWLLVVYPELDGAAFPITVNSDFTFQCPSCALQKVSAAGTWSIDPIKKRLKARFSRIGVRVDYEVVDDTHLKFELAAMDAENTRYKNNRFIYLYKLN